MKYITLMITDKNQLPMQAVLDVLEHSALLQKILEIKLTLKYGNTMIETVVRDKISLLSIVLEHTKEVSNLDLDSVALYEEIANTEEGNKFKNQPKKIRPLLMALQHHFKTYWKFDDDLEVDVDSELNKLYVRKQAREKFKEESA